MASIDSTHRDVDEMRELVGLPPIDYDRDTQTIDLGRDKDDALIEYAHHIMRDMFPVYCGGQIDVIDTILQKVGIELKDFTDDEGRSRTGKLVWVWDD